MSGGGIGSALGTGLGLVLAPETGGASLAIPAALGAAGGAIGGGVTGGDPLTSGAMGALGGLLGGALGPTGNALGLGPSSEASSVMGDVAAEDAANSSITGAAPQTGGASSGSWLSNLFGGGSSAVSPAGGGISSKISGYIGNHPIEALGGASALLGALTSSGAQKTDLAGKEAEVRAQHPGFYSNLPVYNYSDSYTPPQGDWYTYGQRPQGVMYKSRLTPAAAQGGLIRGYARGGLAMGGQPMIPQQGVPTMLGQPPQASPPANAAAFQTGHKLGTALRARIQSQGLTPLGQVHGGGKGQADAIPAKLSQDEFVIPADVVSQLGDGSSNAGGKELTKMIHKVRAHKTSHKAGFPPKAKNPLSYIGKRA